MIERKLKNNYIESICQGSILYFVSIIKDFTNPKSIYCIKTIADAKVFKVYLEHLIHADYNFSQFDKVFLGWHIEGLKSWINARRKELKKCH